MAEHFSEEDLRKMSPAELNRCIKGLENNQEKPDLADETKISLRYALMAAKLALQSKKKTSTVLEANAGNRDALNKLFNNMNAEELMDAFDHYAASQRELFEEYLVACMRCKSIQEEGVDLSDELNHMELPSFGVVFEGVEKVVLRNRVGLWSDAKPLKSAMRFYNDVI